MTSWLRSLALKRQANVSAVAVVSTLDHKRVAQLVATLSDGLEEMLGVTYERRLFYDLQRQRLLNLATEPPQPVELSPMELPVTRLDAELVGRPTIAVISFIFSSRHAEALADWLQAWSQDPRLYERDSFVVVFVADEGLLPTPVLRSVAIHRVAPSTSEEREAILSRIAERAQEKLGLSLSVTPQLVVASSGLNLHETESATLESLFLHQRFEPTTFTNYKISILRKYGITYITPTRGFESVGGYDYLKRYIVDYVIRPLRQPELAQHYGITPPRGLLLFGPPGCGKSWMAKAFSKEVGLPMLSLDPSTFYRGIVGETEARVRQVRELVESLSPVIVFIDEIDQVFMARERQMVTDSGVTRRFQSMMLEWLGDEHRRSFIVGATNFVGDLDPAFIRPGRIDEIVVVLPPDREARAEILRVHTNVVRKVPLSPQVDLDAIAGKTYLWSGAELEKLVVEAARLAFVEEAEAVEPHHFEEALRVFEVNLPERERNLQRLLREAERLENVNRGFLQEALRVFTKAEGEDRVSSLLRRLRE